MIMILRTIHRCIRLTKGGHLTTLSHVRSASTASSSVCLLNSERALVDVRGSTSEHFLQNLLTNDMNIVNEKGVMFTMLLNSKGRIMFDLIVYRGTGGDGAGSFLLECEAGRSEQLVNSLNKLQVRKKVKITSNHSHNLYAVFPPVSPPHHQVEGTVNDEIYVTDPRVQSFADRRLIPADKDRCDSSTTLISPADYHYWRTLAGIGENQAEMSAEHCTPLECNVDIMNGVSFTKGCYIGQELTARTHYRGVVRKRLLPVATSHAVLADQAVYSKGKRIGIVKSVSVRPNSLSSASASSSSSSSSSSSPPEHVAMCLIRVHESTTATDLEVKDEHTMTVVASAEVMLPSWWPSSLTE